MFDDIDGGTLADWLHTFTTLPQAERWPRILRGMLQVAEAREFFHHLPTPIVHRDLKPSNLLWDRTNDLLKVTDFGIGAVAVQEANRLEQNGGGTRGGRLQSYLRGSHTPIYSSPQQRRGDDPNPTGSCACLRGDLVSAWRR